MRADSAGVQTIRRRAAKLAPADPFPQLLVEGPEILFAGFLLVALLAIATLVIGYQIGKLRGDQNPPAISSPAPAGQVGSENPPADAVSSTPVTRTQT